MILRPAQILACLATLSALLISSPRLLAVDCNCPKPMVTISAIPPGDPVLGIILKKKHVDPNAVPSTDPSDDGFEEITSGEEQELIREQVYQLKIEATGDISIDGCDVKLTFPHCQMQWRPVKEGEESKFDSGTEAIIHVSRPKPDYSTYDPINPAGVIKYSPQIIEIRVSNAPEDSQSGSGSSPGSDANAATSPAVYDYNSATNSPVLSPPGIGLEIPMGSAKTPEGYRSAGLLVNYGPVSSGFAAPTSLAYTGIAEVGSMVSEHLVQSGGVTAEKHYSVPQGVFRVRGWDSATQSPAAMHSAQETLVEVYAPENYTDASHTFSGEPHSYYRLEVATDGLRIVQSNFGLVSTRLVETSGDGLLLRDTEGSRVTESVAIPPAQGQTSWSRQTTVKKDGIVVSSNLKTYELKYGTRYDLTWEIEDPNGAALTTGTSYYSDGRVRSVSRPDSSWSYYTYWGNETTTYSPWLSSCSLAYSNGVWSLPTSGTVVKSVSWSDTVSRWSNSYLTNLSGGSTIQMSGSYSWESDDNQFLRTSRSENRGNGNIESYSLSYSPQNADRFLAGRTLMTWDGTGKATLYQYEKGYWSGSGFMSDANGDCVRASSMTGHIASPSAWSGAGDFTHVPGHSTQEVSIKAQVGVIREETYVHAGGGYQLAVAKDHEYESAGQLRPIGVKINGIYVSKTEYVSPTVTRQWSEDGSMTETEVDAEGETIRSTTSGSGAVPAVTTLYDRVGLTTTTTVNGQTVSVETQDLAGRTVLSQDATGAVASTTYTDGGRTETRTAPGGVTTVETRHFDGQAISTTGSGVIPRYYSYSVGSNGRITTTTAVGATNSPRVTSTTQFWDGSTESESSPDPAGGGAPIVLTYTYASNSSNLVRAHSSASNTADQLQLNPAGSAEAAMGDYSLSGYETDGNGPAVASSDRLSDSTSSYVVVGGIWNRQTIARSFHTDSSSASLTRTSLQALAPVAVSDSTYGDGLRWTSSISNGTTTITSHRDCFFAAAATVQSSDNSATSVSPDSVNVSLHGKAVSSSVYGSSAPRSMTYDASGRMIRQTSATGANTTYGYNAAGQLETTTDHEGKVTTSLYHPNDHQNAGMLWKTINPHSEVTETLYNTRGQVIETTGNGTYRVTYGYNAYGEKDTMRTYRSGSTGDLTQWTYDPATGVLKDKTDAASQKTLYTYDSNGRLKTRTWARPGSVKTNYTYNAFGDLTFTDYSDTTPDVTVVPDRLGRPVTITDASGTRSQAYQPVTGDLDLVSYASSGLLPSLQIDYTQDSAQRPSGYSVAGGGPASVLGYDAAGRLLTVASSGSTHTHGYIPGTGTLANLTTTSGSTTVLTRTLHHDRMRRLRGIVTANASGNVLSRHGYTLDAAGRRKIATRENGQRWDYGYDPLGQVTSAVKKFPGDAAIPGYTFGYNYDGIGNRTSATQGGTDTDVTYTPNALNQYTAITTEGGRFILGEAPVANAVTVNGSTAARAGGLGFYWKQITGNNSASPLWSTDSVVSNDTTITGKTWTPKASVAPVYDADGNLTSDGRWNYTWDAENRTTRMETTSAAATAGVPHQRLDFVYDSQGRRVSKTVSTSTDGTIWTFASSTRFLYDGWNLIAEYSAPSSTSTTLTLQASHTWGIDLSGTPQGAGGVGGLLATHLVTAPAAACYPAYDGNGNVSAWIDASGALLGRMDYSPFGQLIAQYKFTPEGDTKLARLKFGFSTKYTDSESGQLYYGYRYYDPVNGKWTSRDPIQEKGGVNLYSFSQNCSVCLYDILGLDPGGQFASWAIALNDAKKYLRDKGNNSLKTGGDQFKSAFGAEGEGIFTDKTLYSKMKTQAGSDYTVFENGTSTFYNNEVPLEKKNWVLIIGREVASSVYCYQSKADKKIYYSYNYYDGLMQTKAEFDEKKNHGRIRNEDAGRLSLQKIHGSEDQILKHYYFVHTHLLRGYDITPDRTHSRTVFPGLSEGDKAAGAFYKVKVIAIEFNGESE
jgi:RHS repeat-associated protein